MAQVREVKSSFERIIQDNNSVIHILRETKVQIGSDRGRVDHQYGDVMHQYITGLFEPLDRARLTQIGQLTGNTGSNGFLEKFQHQLKDSESSAKLAQSLQEQLGNINDLEDKFDKQERELKVRMFQLKQQERNNQSLEKLLQPIVWFNKSAEAQSRPALNEKDMSYFTSKKGLSHIFAYCTNSHYRQGRKLIQGFQGGSIPEAFNTLLQNEKLLNNEVLIAMEASKDSQETNRNIFRIQKALSGAKSESAIIEGMVAEVSLVLSNQKNFDIVSRQVFGFPSYAVELRAKQNAFAQMEQRVDNNMQAMLAGNLKLQEPLTKLNKISSRHSHRDMTINLHEITNGYKQARDNAKNVASKTRQSSAAIRDYKFDDKKRDEAFDRYSSSPSLRTFTTTDFLMLYMISDMMSNPATQLVDFSTVVPQVDLCQAAPLMSELRMQELPAIDHLQQNMYDIVSGQIPTDIFDDNKFNNFSVPDVSVPDVYVPDVNVSDYGSGGSSYDSGSSSYDSGSSSSYDSGSSSDSGSSFSSD